MLHWQQPPLRWIRRLWLLWLIAAALLVVGAILWAAVAEPAWLLPDSRGLSPADRVKAQTDFRNTMVTMLGGLAVLAGAVVGGLTLRETGRQNRAVLEFQRRGQVTERFTKAIEQLGDEKLDVRIGAVYALEQIARDSAELHWPIMEVLTAYLREHAPARATTATERPLRRPADHQAIATVLGRRHSVDEPEGRSLDLRETNLLGADLCRANLRRVVLRRAMLFEADLIAADLHAADLVAANLVGADLRAANLSGADLGGSILRGANLVGANLAGAALIGADLSRADLTGALGATAAQLASAANIEGARLDPDLTEQLAQRPHEAGAESMPE